jgi:type I restriction enzyme S subunit
MISDTPHYENEVPFEVPESWEWTTIGEIASSILYGVSESAKETGQYKLLRITDIQNNKVNWETVPFTDYDNNKAQAFLLNDGDILFARTGATVGKSYLVEGLRDSAIYASYLIRVQTSSVILPAYIKFFFESGFYWEQISLNSVGIGQPNVNGTTLAALAIPIPPYREQLRIVEEAKKWLSVIDGLDVEIDDLQTYITQVKSRILDLAIHGKLVPQDPNDEPAIELLKRINPKFVPCDNAHYPFDVPHNWVWAKGLDIFKPMKATSPLGDTFKYIDIDAIDNKRNVVTSVKVLNTKQAPSRASRYTEKGCVLFSMVRPYLRNIAMVTENDCIASTGFFVCQGKGCLLPKFCYYQMLSNYVVDGLNDFMKGDNSPSITKAQIEEYIFPLPPYNEQQRIVTKIEELFAVLDKIQKSIEA